MFHLDLAKASNKGNQILALKEAKPREVTTRVEIPADSLLVCAIHNVRYDETAVVTSRQDLRRLTNPADHRPRRWFLVDKEWALRNNPGLKKVLR